MPLAGGESKQLSDKFVSFADYLAGWKNKSQRLRPSVPVSIPKPWSRLSLRREDYR